MDHNEQRLRMADSGMPPAAPASVAEIPNPLEALPADALILIPTRNLVLFPGTVLPITLGRLRSIAAGIAMIRTNGEWLLVLSGIISVLLGIILFVQPGAGVIALSWWLGVYALLFGISLIGAAFRLRHWHPA